VPLTATPTELPDVLLLQPDVHTDDRGSFMESWNQRDFDAAVGRTVRFVQDNHSTSRRGVLRGLHYQLPPHAQAKLVRVVRGRAFDVAVDVRRSSATFGRWTGVELSAANRRQLWIPEGFAHGLLALEDGTETLYKTTAHHHPDAQRSLAWDDAQVGIRWPLAEAAADGPVLSPRDACAPALADAECFA
jgi:dTDP-4-dehydrorhamnose 3,5-epimerase